MRFTASGLRPAWLALGLMACSEDPGTLAEQEPLPEPPATSPGTGPEPTTSATTDPGEDPGAATPPTQPPGWDEDLALNVPEDLNPDPNVLEVEIEAREADVEILPGKLTRLWSYNGVLPGPLLRLKRGDRLIVHFTNRLPEATTVHWHGVRVPNSMDGSPSVQNPVEPGESFTYDFPLLDAGTYWYHPHINSSSQVGYGLYGALVVDDPEDPVPVDDVVLMFSDISIDEEGVLHPGDSNGWFGDYFGREGTVALVNGKLRPQLLGTAGRPQRWRVINAARSRFFQMGMEGVPMVRIGGDGGLVERPLPIEKLNLSPSERAEVLVTPQATTSGRLDVMLEDADRFNLGVQMPAEVLLDYLVSSGDAPATEPLPETLRSIPEFDLEQAIPRRIEFGEATIDGDSYLTINGVVHGLETNAEGEHQHGEPHLGYVGDTEIWEVVNTTLYDHPFHLHGFSFEVLDQAGEPWPVRELKDTINVPAKETVRFVLTYDDRPGSWMFHCHILDHAKLGMMAELEVRSR